MTDPLFSVISLDGFKLPADSLWLRKHVRAEPRQDAHYLERYDRRTVTYDCFYNPVNQCFTLTMPRLLNQWVLFKKHLYLNDQPFTGRIKRTVWQRCEQINVFAKPTDRLSIYVNGDVNNFTSRQTHRNTFNGLNCALAINKNNALRWIENWVRFHVNAHGLEGVCIIDNESNEYSSNELLETIRSVDGVKSAVVIEANFPYGPSNYSKKLEVSPRFLQSAMFNLVKQDMFADARAVLSVDIDELVVPNSSTSVFDAAKSSFMGAVSFREIQVFPVGDEEKAYDQTVHTLVKADGKLGNTKWCVAGDGFINRFGWAVHRFGGGYFLLTETKDFNYLHCQATSTSWKKNRYKKPEGLVESSLASDALKKFLP